MKKLMYRLLFIQSFALLAALAQPVPISSIRIYTEPGGGAEFMVDGTPYYNSQTFLWPQGSKHILQFPLHTNIDGSSANYQENQDGNIRFTFNGWIDNRGLLSASSPSQTVTADPAVTFVKASVSLQYRVALRFSNSPVSLPPCTAPGNPPQDAPRSGVVYVAGACYGSDADIWLAAGSIPLQAFPYPGWVFTGWNLAGQMSSPYLTTVNIISGMTIRPVFQQAKRVHFITDPPGLQLLIDRTPTPTSRIDWSNTVDAPCQPNLNLPPNGPAGFPPLCYGEFDFLPGSQHVIGAVTPQPDTSGKYWVFDSFSNGMAQNSVYTVPSTIASKDVITAKFVQGIQTLFTTSPAGLKLQVDGKDSWQYYTFIWPANSTHTFTAPAVQTDSKGRKWTFQKWSNDGPASQTFTVDPSKPSYLWNAVFQSMGQVKIQTNPPGIHLQVDGADCISPCVIDRAAGTQVNVTAPASLPQSDTSRLDFLGWTDGGANSKTITFASDVTTIAANYGTSYRLTTLSDPANGVDLRFDPPSADGFFPGDSVVTVTAAARPGFKFRRWGGDANGVYPAAGVTVNSPRTVVAMLDRIPYIAPAGVRSAAGPSADGTVAPGSIISIMGESLAPRQEVGPNNPLAQTIADVVVTVNDRLLPLLFVSPQQINAQVLSDLPDGDYTLKVRWSGQPDVTGAFTISRNAPGLFTRSSDARPFSLASHEDGSPVTPDSPAHAGETVTLFGTGFGPYDRKVIDGYITPDPSNYAIFDPVEVTAADQPIQPLFTGAAPGFVGTTITRLKIDDSIPKSTNVEIRVKVNGKPSNTVLLPVE